MCLSSFLTVNFLVTRMWSYSSVSPVSISIPDMQYISVAKTLFLKVLRILLDYESILLYDLLKFFMRIRFFWLKVLQ